MTTIPPHAKKGKVYTVYTLIDPRDHVIRYVGITHDVYQRMRQHSRCEGNNEAKNTWIRELQNEQIMFIMSNIEQVKTWEKALEREAAWIKTFLEAGVPLLNIAIAESLTKSSIPCERKQSSAPCERKQMARFNVDDLGQILFRYDGQIYCADTVSSDIFHSYVVYHINTDAKPVFWDSRHNRKSMLNQLWRHCEDHQLQFPYTISKSVQQP